LTHKLTDNPKKLQDLIICLYETDYLLCISDNESNIVKVIVSLPLGSGNSRELLQ